MPQTPCDLRRSGTRQAFRTLNRIITPAVKAGFGSPPPIGAGLVVLETTGRSSGLRRQVPLVATRFGTNVAVSTVRSGSQWVRNLQTDPNATVWVGGRKHVGTATVTPGTPSVAKLALQPSG